MTVLVTGATGVIGRTAIAELLAAGVRVRAVSRSGDAAGLPDCEVVRRPDDLRGIEAIVVHPRATSADIDDLVRRATAGGVRRLVVLSAVNVEDDPQRQPSRYRGDRNAEVEAAVVAGARAGGYEAVVLRCAEFAGNSVGTIAVQTRLGDIVRGAYPHAVEATLDERDIGGVAARAARDDSLAGRRLILTGPEALTLPERVAAVSAATGRALRFVEVDPAAAASGLLAAGLPAGFVQVYLALQAEREHTSPIVSHDVAEVLGRPARTYAEWARDHSAWFAASGESR
jgi:uncharacterized protein YbjT (DUF2867 family)